MMSKFANGKAFMVNPYYYESQLTDLFISDTADTLYIGCIVLILMIKKTLLMLTLL